MIRSLSHPDLPRQSAGIDALLAGPGLAAAHLSLFLLPARRAALVRELLIIAAAPGIRLGTADDERRRAVELGLLSPDPDYPRCFVLTGKGRAFVARHGFW